MSNFLSLEVVEHSSESHRVGEILFFNIALQGFIWNRSLSALAIIFMITFYKLLTLVLLCPDIYVVKNVLDQ